MWEENDLKPWDQKSAILRSLFYTILLRVFLLVWSLSLTECFRLNSENHDKFQVWKQHFEFLKLMVILYSVEFDKHEIEPWAKSCVRIVGFM
jgi:hypothetical protein